MYVLIAGFLLLDILPTYYFFVITTRGSGTIRKFIFTCRFISLQFKAIYLVHITYLLPIWHS